MKKVAGILHYINHMTYDYYTLSNSFGHHTNLYPPYNYNTDHSAQKTYYLYLAAGVPKEKLVLGIAFYGRRWYVKPVEQKVINSLAHSTQWVGGYT